ncbi:MAG: phosphoribosylanthranilate isomerase, partial [Phaeodactylibacter sp.]|nr:phosphoribosylanthranilate isomerase [Phaeodactylibacter sp.]
HNWDFSAAIVRQSGIPVWLAGGLKSGNVQDAIAQVRPHGVDICSGLRPGNGDLDPKALQQFMQAVKGGV